MKRLLAVLVLAAACSKPAEEPAKTAPAETPSTAAAAPAAPAPAAGESEKDKALAHPYPNDLGPASLPADYVASLGEHKKGYDLLVKRCSQCHTASRPLNSRFVEVDEKEQARLKKEQPSLLADLSIRQVETGVWNRYVKRMMSKPGCDIEKAEGKLIWQFLVADGKARKLGASAASWEAHRKSLLAEFKTKHPARYDELKAAGDL